MKYSYISPRKKSVVTPEVKLLVTFFGITLFMLFITYAFLLIKDYTFANDKLSVIQKDKLLHAQMAKMKDEIIFIEKQKVLAQTVQTKNLVLKDSITNLFDLVPERITLSQATLDKNALILHGITPNKDVYNFMLQAPLRSIFHRTYSSFYPAGNGWLRFVSTNYTDKEEERQEVKKEEEVLEDEN